MRVEVRKVSKYISIDIACQGVAIDCGLMNKQEAMEFLTLMKEAVEELNTLIVEMK